MFPLLQAGGQFQQLITGIGSAIGILDGKGRVICCKGGDTHGKIIASAKRMDVIFFMMLRPFYL